MSREYEEDGFWPFGLGFSIRGGESELVWVATCYHVTPHGSSHKKIKKG